MRLTFIGAAHEVTGSCYCLEAAGKRFLVDYGMEQGKNIFENKPLPFPAASLDFVLLTHAHIDHSGSLPKLFAQGFRGPVYTTEATAALAEIMLMDSAHIQEFEAEWRNRKGKRAGKEEFVPEFTMEDATGLIRLIESRPYRTEFSPAEGIRVRFLDAGHLLGSASIELWLREGGTEKKLVFSGDIGNLDQPLLRDPSYPEEADYVIMESTYGDRTHDTPPDYTAALAEVLQQTFDRGGNVVIPSFAIGRTQEMLYFLRQIKQDGLVHGHDGFPVYVDSPLAIEATTIFREHYAECYDEDAMALIRQGINPLQFDGLRTSVSTDESIAINADTVPKVILSASGMCDAGRVKHHLKHNLWRPECTVLFVGYQSAGTPGRALVDGAETLQLFGEPIAVRADIRVLPGISGHADDRGLLKWASSFRERPQMIFVTHGEDTVTEHFAERLRTELGCDAYAPYSGTVFDLASGVLTETPAPVRISKAPAAGASQKKLSVVERLVAAGQRLQEVIRRNEGGANKDLSRLADQINSLCDKWDR